MEEGILALANRLDPGRIVDMRDRTKVSPELRSHPAGEQHERGILRQIEVPVLFFPYDHGGVWAKRLAELHILIQMTLHPCRAGIRQ